MDWATGALLIPAAVAREVGPWYEEFFLYSEETDYFRRVRFDPSAVVTHFGEGVGHIAFTPGTDGREPCSLRGTKLRAYSVLFRAVIMSAEGLRPYDAGHRRMLDFVLDRRCWQELSNSMKQIPAQDVSGRLWRGAVIVPAYNEEVVINRTLTPLSRAAVDGIIELIVVCNGCTDHTAEVARSVPGVRVLELEQGSKPGALNAGDEAATLWPRLYLDADIQISAAAVLAVLDRLAQGDVLAARPDCRYDSDGASAIVRSYYRARQRIPQHKLAMWGAGAYGLSAKGHQRFGVFPMITGDDLYVDTWFDADEKVVVAAEPSVVKTPADVKSLLAILRRSHRGTAELSARGHEPDARMRKAGLGTAVAAVRGIRGPQSAVDASVYIGMAFAKRWTVRQTQIWERDESSRSSS